jgi:hypothetical protein
MEFRHQETVLARLVVKMPGDAGHEREVQAGMSHVVEWLKGQDPDVEQGVREAMGWAEQLPPSFTCSVCGTILEPGGGVRQMTREEKVKYAKMALTKDPELAEMLRKAMEWRDIPHRDSAAECWEVFQALPGIAEDIIRAYLNEHPNMASRLSIGFERQYCEALRLLHDIRVAMNLADAPPKDLAGNVCRKVGLMNDTIRDLKAKLESTGIDDAHCVKVHCEFSDCSYFAEVRKLNTSGLVNDKEDTETYAEAMIRNLREAREQLDQLGKRRASGERGPLCELVDEDLRVKLMWLFGTMTELGLRAEPGQTIIEQAEHHLRVLKGRREGLKNDRGVLDTYLNQLRDTMDHLRLRYNVGDILAIGQAGDHLRVLKARCDESQQEVERLRSQGYPFHNDINTLGVYFRDWGSEGNKTRAEGAVFRDKVRSELLRHAIELCALDGGRGPANAPFWRVTVRLSDPPCPLFTRDVKVPSGNWYSVDALNAIVEAMLDSEAASPSAPEPENIPAKMVVDLIWSCQQYIRALSDGRHPACELRGLLYVLMGAMPIPRDTSAEWPTREWWGRAIQSMLDVLKKETPSNV